MFLWQLQAFKQLFHPHSPEDIHQGTFLHLQNMAGGIKRDWVVGHKVTIHPPFSYRSFIRVCSVSKRSSGTGSSLWSLAMAELEWHSLCNCSSPDCLFDISCLSQHNNINPRLGPKMRDCSLYRAVSRQCSRAKDSDLRNSWIWITPWAHERLIHICPCVWTWLRCSCRWISLCNICGCHWGWPS